MIRETVTRMPWPHLEGRWSNYLYMVLCMLHSCKCQGISSVHTVVYHERAHFLACCVLSYCVWDYVGHHAMVLTWRYWQWFSWMANFISRQIIIEVEGGRGKQFTVLLWIMHCYNVGHILIMIGFKKWLTASLDSYEPPIPEGKEWSRALTMGAFRVLPT